MRTTRTYAVLPVPSVFYDLIKAALLDAGYDHAILREGDGEVLDMHGIALAAEKDVP